VYPKLRAIEIIPFHEDGNRQFALRDPTGLAEQTIAVSPPVLFILERLDGTHDLETIRSEFEAAAGSKLPRAQLEQLVASLDAAHFLESPSFLAHRDQVIQAFRSAPSREAQHGGLAYPTDPESLRDWYFSLEPKIDGKFQSDGRLVGAAAPHIDTRYGGASCRLVHESLVERRPDLDTLVVLGTGHCAGEDLYTLTPQNYGTPLGALATDRELLDGIVQRVGGDALFSAEILHRGEHSVEFQAVFAALANTSRTPPRLLPVLVGSFHQFMEGGIEPWSSPFVRGFVEATQEEVAKLGRRVAYLASIDLSHLGPRYGDERGLTQDEAARIETADRELLRFAEEGDAEGFFRHNQLAKDDRRVCGFAALYTLLRLLPGARGSLLRYEQTTFPETEDTVAHCAMVFEIDE
jgi:AmmeMemoRadiSam system protein B